MTNISPILRDHYDDPFHRGDCESATHAAELQHDETGCQLQFELGIADGVVHSAWFDGRGCIYCEALASLLAELAESSSADEWARLSQNEFLRRIGVELDDAARCVALPLAVLQSALLSPIVALDEDLADGTSFGGPSLREEC